MQGAADSKPERASDARTRVVDLRFAWAASLALAGTCVLLWLAGWLTRDWISAWPRFADDAFYYLVIARNAATGHGFTMDQISPTNGFQPLWMLALVPIAGLAGGDRDVLLLVVQGLSVLLFAASGGLLCGLVRARLGLAPALLSGLLLLFPRLLNVSVSGMESALLILVLVALIVEALRSDAFWNTVPRASDARAGALVGLLMLARLDSVFIGLTLAGYVALRGLTAGEGVLAARLTRTVRKGLMLFWPTLVLVTPYLAWNQIEFGRMMPISGVLKSSFPVPGFEPSHLNLEHAGLLLLAVGAVAREIWRGNRGDPLVRVLAVLSIGLLLHAIHSVIFMRWAVFAWHFSALIPAGVLGVALIARGAADRLPRTALIAGFASLALLQVAAFAFSTSRIERSFTVAGREGGEWVAENLPADAVLGMKDSGIFSFFAQRRVMNLDGVANSFEFAEAVCRGRLAEFIRDRGVEYIVQHGVPSNVRSHHYETHAQAYPCGLPGGQDGVLLLQRELEVFRGSLYRNSAGEADRLLIWRLARESAEPTPSEAIQRERF